MTARSSSASSAGSRARSAASPSAARSGAPAVTEQARYDADGRAVPDDVLPHLPAPRRRRLAARGRRRRRALGRRRARIPALAASLERGDEEQRRLRPELPGGIGGQTRTGSLKCLHAHAAFALARPGYELGERILAEVEPLWPERCCSDY